MNRLLSVTFLFSAFVSISLRAEDQPGAGEKRTLTFHRPEAVGAKYELSSKASLMRTTDFVIENDRLPAAETVNFEVTLDGTLQVTAVAPKSGITRGYTITVKKMTLKDGSGADDGLEPGTIITAKLDKMKTVFVVNGGDVTGTLEEGLREALPGFSASDEPIDDLLAPPGAVAAGEKWTPDAHKIADGLTKAQGITVDPAKSSISVTYKGPATVAGIECDDIVSTHTLTLAKVDHLPEGSRLKQATVTSDYSYSLPRDVKIVTPPQDRNVSDTEIRFTYKPEEQDKDVEVHFKIHEEVRRTMKLVK